jgi:hypothetical protein
VSRQALATTGSIGDFPVGREKRAFVSKNWPSIAQKSFGINGLSDVWVGCPAAEFSPVFGGWQRIGSGIRKHRPRLRY